MSTEISAREDTAGRTSSRQPGPGPGPGQPQKRIPWMWLILAVIILAVGTTIVPEKIKEKSNTVSISGRIEARETYITAGVGTTVNSVRVREGDPVRRGQILLTLNPAALRVKMQASGSQEALARQAEAQANKQVEAAQHDIDTARAKSKGFLAKIFGSKKKKEAEKERLTNEMKSAQMQLMQARAALIKSRAARGEVSTKMPYFTITSPIDGICVTRSIEPGETVAPGQVLLSIIDPANIYMKGFVPEGELSRIKIGQAASIILDTNNGKEDKDKNHRIPARITSIDNAPSFTPQNVYFKEDRIKQVFGIKLSIDDPDGRAKPGVPCEARIDFKRDK